MKKVATLFLFVFSFAFSLAQSRYKEAWKDSTLPIIIDPYSENPIDFDSLVADKRVCGIIHKATQGFSADKAYAQREFLARQKGLLWGSYHMGMAGDPIRQADFYLMTAQIDSMELMALDLEGLDTNYFMSLLNAEKFVGRIHDKTGRYPLIYCNNNVLEAISTRYNDTSVFSKCGLWYARFVKEMPAFNRNVWRNYSLWQFSCEINCKKTASAGIMFPEPYMIWM